MGKSRELEHLENKTVRVSTKCEEVLVSFFSNTLQTKTDKPFENGESLDLVSYEKRSKQLNRRLDIRILPLCCWIYLLNFLDRGNIGNARVLNSETGDDMLQQTRMTPNDYAITLTVFSLCYALFEVPSNWVMKHYVRPSLWLAFLLFAWGCVTIGFAGVQNYATVLSLRLLIGVFEAGFFPGIVYFITIWYRHNERAVRIAMVVAFCNMAGAFGGAIAFGIGHVNGAGGLQGFRWLFIVSSIDAVDSENGKILLTDSTDRRYHHSPISDTSVTLLARLSSPRQVAERLRQAICCGPS